MPFCIFSVHVLGRGGAVLLVEYCSPVLWPCLCVCWSVGGTVWCPKFWFRVLGASMHGGAPEVLVSEVFGPGCPSPLGGWPGS